LVHLLWIKGLFRFTVVELRLIIEDSGVGIKEPQKIFDRYYKESQRGIGIGLHIVKKLCDEIGVDIRIETEIGVGSRFILVDI